MKRGLGFLILIFCGVVAKAQPSNDLWKNAIEIIPQNDGFATGTFKSQKVSFHKASIEINEPFDQVISAVALDQKTVWFRFSIKTARNVSVKLKQPNISIQPLDIGMSVYSNVTNYPSKGQLSYFLPSISQQGETSSNCLPAGTYYIQVCARNYVKDTCFIELTLNENEYEGNSVRNAIKLSENTEVWLTRCASIDSLSESTPFNSQKFTQSSYYYFKTFENSVRAMLNMRGSKVGIVLYKGGLNQNPSSWETIRVFNWIQGSHEHIERLICSELEKDTCYILKVLGYHNCYFRLEFNQSANYQKLGTSPLNPILLNTIRSYREISVGGVIDCNNDYSLEVCPDLQHLLKDTIFVINDSVETDSFVVFQSAGFWSTFHVERNIKVSLEAPLFMLFNKIASKNTCELPPPIIDSGSIEICLKPGSYTMLLSTHKHGVDDHGFVNNFHVGDRFSPEIRFEIPVEDSSQIVAKYPIPQQAQNLGKLSTKSVDTAFIQTDWLNGSPSTFKFENETRSGYFSFARFQLMDSASISFDHYTGTAYKEIKTRVYAFDNLYKTESWKSIHTKNGEIFSRKHWSKSKLPPGKYIVVFERHVPSNCEVVRRQKTDSYLIFRTKSTSSAQPICKHLFGSAKSAHIINNFNPIQLDCSSKDGLEWCTINLPNTCTKNPNNLSNALMFNYMKYRKNITGFSYYVFNCSQNFKLNARLTDNFQLVEGDISKDSSITQKSENIIAENAFQRSEFCGLKKGVYSIIILCNSENTGGELRFEKAAQSKNDHARFAEDLGELNNKRTIVNAFVAFSCRSSYHSSDPVANTNHWHTFLTSGPAKISVNTIEKVLLIKASENQNKPFSQLQSSNSVDSTLENGAVVVKPDADSKNGRTFTIATNETARYYLITHLDRFAPRQYKVIQYEIRYEKDAFATYEGDQCNNAKTVALTGTTLNIDSSYNGLHTLGEGPGENDLSQWFDGDLAELKSTWFEYEIAQNEGNKVGFHIPDNSGIQTARIYFGACNILTPGSILENNGSIIKLDCIANGSYFIQAISTREQNEFLKFGAQITLSNENCNPIDLNKVIANFSHSGGCSNDTILFTNHSSAGNLISYEWKANGIYLDTTRHVEYYHPKKSSELDTLRVLLKVKNRITNAADSISKTIVVGEPKVVLPADTIACGDSILLRAKTPYHDANFEWRRIEYSGTGNVLSINQKESFKMPSYFLPLELQLKTSISNCSKIDTITIRNSFAGLASYGNKCPNTDFTLHFPNTWQGGFINNTDTLRQLKLDKIGHNRLSILKDNCQAEFNFKLDKIYAPKSFNNEVGCGERHLLNIENLNWIAYDSFGIANTLNLNDSQLSYPITWKYEEPDVCPDLADTIRFSSIQYIEEIDLDTITCTKNPITLTTGDNSSQIIWSTGDTAQTITVNNSRIYTALIRKANCVFYDTAYVTFYNAPRIKPLDTTFCPEDSAISLQAFSNWPIEWSNGDTKQLAKFEAGGDFWLKINDPFCPAIDTFRLEVDCSNQLFIPNAFTPNGDAFNPEFIAKGTKIENFEMRIFARNGQLVFYSNNLEDGWDGTTNGQPLPLGKYLYIIQVEIEGETQKHAGTVHLIK